MRIGRVIESALRLFDNEQREWVLRFRLWKHRWFPYRTAELRGWTSDTSGNTDMILGPWKWHRPDVLRRKARNTEKSSND